MTIDHDLEMDEELAKAPAKPISDVLKRLKPLDAAELMELSQEISKANPRALVLNNTGLTAENFTELAPAISENTNLTWLHLRDNTPGDEGVTQIIRLIEEHPALERLILGRNGLSEKGIGQFARLLERNTALAGLALYDNAITDHGAMLLGEAMKSNTRLAYLNLRSNPNIGKAGIKAIEAGVLASGSRNIVSVPGISSPALNRYCAANAEAAKILHARLVKATPPTLTSGEIFDIYERFPAISLRDTRKRPNMDAFEGFLKTLPEFDGQGVDGLFKADPDGYTPLDNPAIWKKFAALGKHFAGQKTSFTLGQWQQENRDGVSFLENALGHAPAHIFVPALNASGIRIQGDLLLDKKTGKPTPLYEAAMGRGELAALFTEQNWQGATQSDLRNVVHALPEKLRATIPNLHTLTARLQRTNANELSHERA